ncbi:MAG: methyltransferase domain-containing protein [Verrucomicrobiia bacterium]|jgi:S-adenosylmethionine-dependent methyltransferase
MIRNIVKKFLLPQPPARISVNFRNIDPEKRKALEDRLIKQYFNSNHQYLSTADGRSDLEDHLYRRLYVFRDTIIPWLDSAVRLSGAKVLEIGCGTGSSTVALAEQGARIVGVDIIEKDLEVAEYRCNLYGLDARFVKANAVDVHKLFKEERFDLIIFFAALEHMTISERLQAIANTWQMLEQGKFWCVTGSPNRLWYFDDHTACLPFFHWLPDELAFYYSKYSPKKSISEQYRELNPQTMLHFLRRGRGISYHEFEIAIGRADTFNVVSALGLFNRKRSLARRLLWNLKPYARFERFLIKNAPPSIHRGFFQPYLDLIIQK